MGALDSHVSSFARSDAFRVGWMLLLVGTFETFGPGWVVLAGWSVWVGWWAARLIRHRRLREEREIVLLAIENHARAVAASDDPSVGFYHLRELSHAISGAFGLGAGRGEIEARLKAAGVELAPFGFMDEGMP